MRAAARGRWIAIDPYALLHLPRDASPSQVEVAYRRAVDALPTSRWGRLARFVLGGCATELDAARQTLCDPQRREAFEKQRAADDRHRWFLMH